MKKVKRQVFCAKNIKNHNIEGKGKEKKKERGGRKEENNGCTLRFIMATLESFWPKKTV